MKSRAYEILEASIARLIASQPLYGTVFLYLKKIRDNSIPTMGVGVYRKTNLGLFYNEKFVEELSDPQLMAVLQHESLHILLHHIFRAKYNSFNHKIYNIAADLAINCNLEGLPDWVYFPEKLGYEDYKSADWYYNKIKSSADKQGVSLEDLADALSGKLLDEHDWNDQEVDIDVIAEKTRAIAEKSIKASKEANKWGNTPLGLGEQILAANRRVSDWKKIVKYFITQQIKVGRKTTRNRPNRRFGYSYPGYKREFKSKVLVAVDTSGSVSRDDLSDFLAEINALRQNVYCELICFDTKLYEPPVEINGSMRSYEFVGRGGTCFEPIMRYVEEHKYDGLIVLSDGEAPFPDEPLGTRVLWGITDSGRDINPPYGRVVLIENN